MQIYSGNESLSFSDPHKFACVFFCFFFFNASSYYLTKFHPNVQAPRNSFILKLNKTIFQFRHLIYFLKFNYQLFCVLIQFIFVHSRTTFDKLQYLFTYIQKCKIIKRIKIHCTHIFHFLLCFFFTFVKFVLHDFQHHIYTS